MGEPGPRELEVESAEEVSEQVLDAAPAEERTESEPEVEAASEEAPVGEEDADGELRLALQRLDSRLEESHRLLGRQSDLVDKLHTENQNLRAGEIRSAQMPLVRDLLRLHDDVGRMRTAGADSDDLRLVQESLVETLARNGIEPFAPERGEPFDPSAHSASGIEQTEDEGLDKTVAEVVRQGFRWDSGDLIRVVEVRAYRYLEPG